MPDPASVLLANILDVQSVRKAFGTMVAVDNVDLQVRRGEFLTLLGPSGCGKTTLLRMIAGFETVTSGRILLGGNDMTHRPPYRRPLGMMFQNLALFPHLSVGGNVGCASAADARPRAGARWRRR